VLRKLSASDLTDFQVYRTDPEVARFQGWEIASDVEARAFLRSMGFAKPMTPGEWFQIGIAARGTDRLIGDIGLFTSESGTECEIGFTLNPKSQGRGLATEAVEALINSLWNLGTVHSIRGITDGRNEKSIQLLERLEMRMVEKSTKTCGGELCEEQVFVLHRPR